MITVCLFYNISVSVWKTDSGYSIPVKNRALPGTDWPALQRSPDARTSSIHSGGRFPLPISINVPTIARTIFLRNLLAETVNTRCSPGTRESFSTVHSALVMVQKEDEELPCIFSKQLKSCLPSRKEAASFIFTVSRQNLQCHEWLLAKGSLDVCT